MGLRRKSGRVDITPPPRPQKPTSTPCVDTQLLRNLTPPDAFQVRCSRCLSSNMDAPQNVHPSDSPHLQLEPRARLSGQNFLPPFVLLLWPLEVRRQWDAGRCVWGGSLNSSSALSEGVSGCSSLSLSFSSCNGKNVTWL